MAEEPQSTSAMKPPKSRKQFRFHEDNMEPTDSEFNEAFDHYNYRSAWFLLMFILCCLPTFCIECERTALIISKNFEGMCIFPELLANNWTVMMTNNLTRPIYATPCSYHMFNFDELRTMTYEQAMKMKKNMAILPPVGTCLMPVEPKNYAFLTPNFLKTCASVGFKIRASTFRTLGEGFSSVLMGIVGDLFGRKFGFMVSFPIYALGLIIQPTVSHYYTLLLASFLEGFGSTGLSILNYILLIEICNPSLRGMFSLYITALEILGRFVAFYIKHITFTYSISTIMCSIPSLSLLFYLMYVPESPRWQLSYGMKRQAWATLGTLGVKISGQVYLPRITLGKGRILYDNMQLLFFTPKYRKSILIVSLAICIEGLIYSNKSSYISVGNLKITSHRAITIMGDFFSFVNVLPPFLIFGRYISILFIYGCVLLLMIIMMFFNDFTVLFIINILTAITLSSMQFVVLLYFCELIPTCTRATALGFTWLFAKAMTIIMHFILGLIPFQRSYKNNNYVMFVLGSCCYVAFFLMPRVYVHNLPDFKRSRSVVEI